MTTSSSPQLLEEILRPVVEQAGYYLEEVKVTQAGKHSVVRVLIDLLDGQAGSVTLDQVAEATKVISDSLDEVSWLNNAYTLEVSSPGATRPLTTPRHFNRSVGRLIKVELSDGAKFTERLRQVTGEQLHFEDNQLVTIKQVRKAQVEVELKRLNEVLDQEDNDTASTGAGQENHEG